MYLANSVWPSKSEFICHGAYFWQSISLDIYIKIFILSCLCLDNLSGCLFLAFCIYLTFYVQLSLPAAYIWLCMSLDVFSPRSGCIIVYVWLSKSGCLYTAFHVWLSTLCLPISVGLLLLFGCQYMSGCILSVCQRLASYD
jgi:hypothetical protein